MKSSNNKGISQRRRCYFVNKGSINSGNKKVIWEKGNISIVRREIRIWKVRQCIGRTHSHARDMDKVAQPKPVGS